MLRALAALLVVLAGAAPAAEIADATGRTVGVPDPATRVYVAGPPAAVLVYVLKPDALLGWSHGLRAADRARLLPAQRNLPELPAVAGDGGAANVEAIAAYAEETLAEVDATLARVPDNARLR
jgi:iron complex transport system substrate-binding protein